MKQRVERARERCLANSCFDTLKSHGTRGNAPPTSKSVMRGYATAGVGLRQEMAARTMSFPNTHVRPSRPNCYARRAVRVLPWGPQPTARVHPAPCCARLRDVWKRHGTRFTEIGCGLFRQSFLMCVLALDEKMDILTWVTPRITVVVIIKAGTAQVINMGVVECSESKVLNRLLSRRHTPRHRAKVVATETLAVLSTKCGLSKLSPCTSRQNGFAAFVAQPNVKISAASMRLLIHRLVLCMRR